MEVVAAVAVIPASIGLALALQFGALKFFLWAVQHKAEQVTER